MKTHRYLGLPTQVFLLLGIVGLIAGTSIFIKMNWGRTQFICSYPKYHQLTNGMTKDDVKRILGKPAKVIEAEDETQNFYCGPGFRNDPQAMQCWWYEFRGWLGNIEVFFDSEDILIGTACGTG